MRGEGVHGPRPKSCTQARPDDPDGGPDDPGVVRMIRVLVQMIWLRRADPARPGRRGVWITRMIRGSVRMRRRGRWWRWSRTRSAMLWGSVACPLLECAATLAHPFVTRPRVSSPSERRRQHKAKPVDRSSNACRLTRASSSSNNINSSTTSSKKS